MSVAIFAIVFPRRAASAACFGPPLPSPPLPSPPSMVLLASPPPVWGYYIAIAAVVAAFLWQVYASPKPQSSLFLPPKKAKEHVDPSTLVAAHAYAGYAYLYLRGKLLDFIEQATAKLFFWRRVRATFAFAPIGKKAGPPIFTGWVVFYTRRLYRRIEDCWNRPIAGEASSSIDVCIRRRNGSGDGAPLEMTGETVRCLNLGSYNYLGFGGVDPVCTPEVIATLREFGVSNCSSRLECGNTRVHQELETTVAAFLEKPAALIIGMGFATNSTVIPVLVDPEGNGKGVLIVSDSLNHSSIVEGVRGSGAKVQPFTHNNMQHLEAILQRATSRGQSGGVPWRKIIILVEGIYSMEGEFCRLREIVALKKRYRAYLYLDEAHSIGAVGPRGRGVTDHLGIPTDEIDVMMGTFTKSFGSVGGYVASSKEVVATLRRHAAGTLYAPSMSPPAAQQALSALKLIMRSCTDPSSAGLAASRMTQLRNNANSFREGLIKMGCRVLGDRDSPIIPIMLYHPEKIYNFSQACLRRGLATVVVGFPATPLLLSRARFCIAASHTPEELSRALKLIEEAGKEVGVLYDKRAASADARSGLDPDREAKERRDEYQTADMSGVAEIEWSPEPIVPVHPPGSSSPDEDFEHAIAAAAAATPSLDLRRTDFLKMACDEHTIAAAEAALKKYGCGTCGPRGFYGTLDVHLELEQKIASFLGTEQAIIYSFGIATISSVVPAFVKPGDVLFVDSGVHFCAAVGARLTRGQGRTFAHNDTAELEALLIDQEARDAKLPPSKRPRRFLLIEGLYVNTGELAPLPELIRLRDRFGCYLIVDETYSFGTVGPTGRGISEHFGLHPADIDILVGSLEHSLGSVGGFCAGSSMIVSHQRLSGSGYCYSASLPAFATCAALEALRLLCSEPSRLSRLKQASEAMNAALSTHIAPLPNVVVTSDPASPVGQIKLDEIATGALSPERAQALLRAVANASAASPASLGVQIMLHSAQAHVQRPRPPSLRLSVHCEVPPEALDGAIKALGACLERELGRIHEAIALSFPPAEKPRVGTHMPPKAGRIDSPISEISSKEVAESASDEAASLVSPPDQFVTVPILRLLEAVRTVSRQYVMRQMEWHSFSLTPSLNKLRAIDSPTLRALTTIGQLLGSEAFYFIIIPFLCWSASDVAHVPMFVAFFSINIYAGCWLKNCFALARPPPGSRSVQREVLNDANDFGWPSMYVVNAVGLPFFALRYWYGGFGTGTQYSMDYPVTTAASYTLAFVWVVLVCCARLYSGVSSPADVQGGLLVGGVLVRLWLSICDPINEWIMSGASYGGLPQWAALLLMAIALMAIHPYTPGDARSWVALSYSTKAVAFGTSFQIGAQACAHHQLTNTLPQTATFYNAGLVVLRNLVGFVGMFLAWRLSRLISSVIEAQLQQRIRLFNSKPCAPRLLRSAFVFSIMGAMVSFGAPALMSSAGM